MGIAFCFLVDNCDINLPKIDVVFIAFRLKTAMATITVGSTVGYDANAKKWSKDQVIRLVHPAFMPIVTEAELIGRSNWCEKIYQITVTALPDKAVEVAQFLKGNLKQDRVYVAADDQTYVLSGDDVLSGKTQSLSLPLKLFSQDAHRLLVEESRNIDPQIPMIVRTDAVEFSWFGNTLPTRYAKMSDEEFLTCVLEYQKRLPTVFA